MCFSCNKLRLRLRGWAEATVKQPGKKDTHTNGVAADGHAPQKQVMRREYVQEVVDPNAKIFCSPLKRAVQTALVALADHPAAMATGITLLEPLREVKSRGGNDCVGSSVGDEIALRALAELPVRVCGDTSHLIGCSA